MTALEEARKSDGQKLTETLSTLMDKTQMVINLSVEKEQLQKQVQYYSERFEDFNDTLTKSNEEWVLIVSGFGDLKYRFLYKTHIQAISSFSSEMQKLQKINGRLEKNAEDWKMKHFKCQQQLIALTESNLKQTEKNEKLEKLCRALQERKANSNDSEKENKV